MPTPLVPRFPLIDTYLRVNQLPTAERWDWARNQVADGCADLAEAFVSSVQELESYDSNEPFRNAPRAAGEGHPASKANRIAFQIAEAGGVAIQGEPALGGEYVDYEVSSLRTTGKAQWSKGGAPMPPDTKPQPGKPVIIDLLLRGREGQPVVTEVKFGGDKDPVAALVQGLVYAATLSTPQQRRRLAAQLPHPRSRGAGTHCVRFAAGGELVDIALLMARPSPPSATSIKGSGIFKADLWWLMPDLIEGVMSHAEIRRHVGAIYGLSVAVDEAANIEGHVPGTPTQAAEVDWCNDAVAGGPMTPASERGVRVP